MPIKIRSKKHKFDFELPSCKEEVTTKFFIDFCKISQHGEIAILSHYTGLSEQELLVLDHTSLDDEVFGALSFMHDLITTLPMLDVPYEIKIYESEPPIKVPRDLNLQTLGQKLRIKQLINSFNTEEGVDNDMFLDCIIPCFVTYFAPLIKENEEKLEWITENLSILDVYPVVNFFLFKLSRL